MRLSSTKATKRSRTPHPSFSATEIDQILADPNLSQAQRARILLDYRVAIAMEELRAERAKGQGGKAP